MPYYFIKCGNLEVTLRAWSSKGALQRFRAKYPTYEHLGTYLTRATRPEMGCAPRGALTTGNENQRIRKTDVKHSVDGRKTSGAEEQEAGP